MDQWEKNVVDFYINNRNKLSDIYPLKKYHYKKLKKIKLIVF